MLDEDLKGKAGWIAAFNKTETLRAIEAATRAPREMSETIRLATERSGLSLTTKRLDEQQDAVRRAIESINAPMRQARLTTEAFSHTDLQLFREAAIRYESTFRTPRISEISRLLEGFTKSPVAQLAAEQSMRMDALKHSLESITAPWLRTQEKLRSITAMVEIQSIGAAINQMRGFTPEFSAALRLDLGDWRDAIALPARDLKEPSARFDLYRSRGFNPDLTDFPAPAFHEGMDAAGLLPDPLDIVETYGPPVPVEADPGLEEGLFRTNKAHDCLQRFEAHLRRFIDSVMTARHGPNWMRSRLPNGLYDSWEEKKRKATEAGQQEFPLIAYADFTDYERVICKADNFREVFQPYFIRPESVRESLQRLYPVRVATMHSRLISSEDVLYLFVEVRRLATAISRNV